MSSLTQRKMLLNDTFFYAAGVAQAISLPVCPCDFKTNRGIFSDDYFLNISFVLFSNFRSFLQTNLKKSEILLWRYRTTGYPDVHCRLAFEMLFFLIDSFVLKFLCPSLLTSPPKLLFEFVFFSKHAFQRSPCRNSN